MNIYSFRIVTVVTILWPLNMALASVEIIDSFQDTQQFNFRYHVTVPKEPSGKQISLWVPYPVENDFQNIIDYGVESTVPWKLSKSDKYGNRMIHSEWVSAGKAVEFVFKYKISRRPSTGFQKQANFDGTPLNPELYKKMSLSIPFAATIQKMASEQVKGLSRSSLKVRALYDHVVDIMDYNKQGTGWGKGDPIWACSNKRGNCTDFHSLYIALARTQGIAARFKIGFPIPSYLNKSQIPGYHCWAEVFDPAFGWIPLDASEAKKTGMKDKYFGRIPSDRILFSVGRDLLLSPPQKGDRINYFIYPYAETDGQKIQNVKKEFSFNRI